MSIAKMTTKGQITVPIEVRNALNVKAGDRVEFVMVASGRYEFIAATRDVRELKGMFGQAKRSISIDAMNLAISQRAAHAK